jgi:hypothetical protein
MQNIEVRQWAMLCHLSVLVGLWLPVPFGNLLGPLLLWSFKKDSDSFIDEQGKEAINFQITVMAIGFALHFLHVKGFHGILHLGSMILVIIAGIQANQGVSHRYPVCWRIIS